MIKSALYRDPQLLDPAVHRHKKVKPLVDLSVAKDMHAVFLAATEFPSAAMSLPIIFVHTGERLPDGKAMIAPVALLGVAANENLVINEGRWEARYVPAFIRRFPFLTAGVQDSESSSAVFVDAAWSGFNDTEGEPLFDADGKPAPVLQRSIEFLRSFDQEQQRTRQFCLRLLELDVLKEMAANATLPDGELKVEGFLTVDEDKLNALPDKDVIELHRNGMLMLLQIHLLSLHNMQMLIERKAMRLAAQAKTAKA
ncbi:SapC family protein [Piscinibacter sp. XHJ-5]|uniref:SapC family protein n=1 Tax=Piscinibacter sp. XHJ-5 TaxID=3037797 RepID=UPI0024530DA4|nr:SapC family protein [Piscinibacter sp. XHJ-5]